MKKEEDVSENESGDEEKVKTEIGDEVGGEGMSEETKEALAKSIDDAVRVAHGG